MKKEKTVEVNGIGGACPTNGAEETIRNGHPYRVEVTLQSVCPLLFHRWNCEAVQEKADAPKGSKSKKTDNLESYVYRNENNEISIPSTYLRGALLEQAKFLQDPRSPRKCARDLFKAGVLQLTPLASIGKTTGFREQGQGCGSEKRHHAILAGVQRLESHLLMMVILPEYITRDMLHEALVNAGRFQVLPTLGRLIVFR
jgi:hypothetical protein